MLPSEILKQIALRLSLNDLQNLCRVNKHLNDIVCKDDDFWRLKYLHDFGPAQPDQSWKEMYKSVGDVRLLYNPELEELTYYYNGNFYTLTTLRKYKEESPLDYTVQITTARDLIRGEVARTSQPIILFTSDDNWFIITDDNNKLKIIAHSSAAATRKKIDGFRYFDVPDLSKLRPGIAYYALPILKLPRVERLYLFIEHKAATAHRFSLSSLNKRQMVPPSFTYDESDVEYHFGPTWYIAPAIMARLSSYFVSLSEIEKLIQSGEIEDFLIDPKLQPYTDPPKSILTFFAKNGRVYLVEAEYDPETNQMFPPE